MSGDPPSPPEGINMNYNLLEEKWIPVLYADGRVEPVGIRRALTNARAIRQIAASNPMDNVALLRLLLAVLQWCKPSLSDDKRAQLDGGCGISDDWLKEKLGTEDSPNAAFDLLGAGERFYQSHTQAHEEPKRHVSDLFAYLPAATEISHFRHVNDQNIALCLNCCAVGLARLPACAMQGGQGKSPSINNAPPIYFLPAGKTLLDTFLLNWPLTRKADGHPAWENKSQPDGEIGTLEGLTWQPRQAWLGTFVQDPEGRCARCGTTEHLVSKVVFKKGRSRRGESRTWRDPHVAWSVAQEDSDNNGTDMKDQALRGPDPLKFTTKEASLWRKTACAVLKSSGEHSFIPSIADAIVRLTPESDLQVACFEPFTKQAKSFDEHSDAWSFSRDLLRNDDLRSRTLAELERLDSLRLDKLILKALPRNTKQRPEVKAALADIAAETERRLRKRFERFVAELTTADTDEKVGRYSEDWCGDVHSILGEALHHACAVFSSGSPLRRREAITSAQQALSTLMSGPGKREEKTTSLEDAQVPAPPRQARWPVSPSETFIRRLEALNEGERSRLRRLAGKPLDQTLPGFDLFTGLWWPLLREKSPCAPERGIAWLVAKLYGAFPVLHVRGGRAQLVRVLGSCERALRNEFDRDRFRRRFDALLQSPLSGLEPHLHWALSTVRRAVAQRRVEGVDWVRLLDDLRLWVRGPDRQDEDLERRHRDIRDIWAEEYLNATPQPQGASHAD